MKLSSSVVFCRHQTTIASKERKVEVWFGLKVIELEILGCVGCWVFRLREEGRVVGKAWRWWLVGEICRVSDFGGGGGVWVGDVLWGWGAMSIT